MKISELLQHTPDDRIAVYKLYNRSPKNVKEDVQTVQQWLKKQPHLPQIFSDHRIETFLILNKFSIERTKQKIDMYFTIRRLLPDLYRGTEPWLPTMQTVAKRIYWLPLPKLTKDKYRVVLAKINESDPDLFEPILFFAQTLNVAEVRLDHDFMQGEIAVYDFSNISLAMLMKVTPVALKKVLTVVEKVYSNRLKGLHYVFAPSYIDSFLKILKSVLKPKLANRIHVHKDLESLGKYVEKSILPKEYGGEERSIHELHDAWQEALISYKPWFEKLNSHGVNEKLRPGKPIDDDVLGFHGNFRKLDLD